jgi:hypothetical protein
MLSLVYRVNSSFVASEVIDGEAIIMNLENGRYHSASGVGAMIWQAILDGASDAAIRDDLTWLYAGEDTGLHLDHFLEQLKDAGLIEMAPGEGVGTYNRIENLPYAPPSLESYGDMEDLIMLDPIHDVSEQHGWPIRPPEFEKQAGEAS